MCRNIKTLANFEPPATNDEVHDAALQFVRKLSGSTKPSKRNEHAYHHAVEAIAAIASTAWWKACSLRLDGLVEPLSLRTN